MLEDAYALSADFGGADRAGNVSAEHFQPAAVGLTNETADFLCTVGARIHHRQQDSLDFQPGVDLTLHLADRLKQLLKTLGRQIVRLNRNKHLISSGERIDGKHADGGHAVE